MLTNLTNKIPGLGRFEPPFNLKIKLANIITILFDKEPTRISGVKVAETGIDYAIITWETNHYATSKVNYGLTFDYGQNVQSDKKVKNREIKITGLESETKYYYEVMSQGKNYVFGARHEFTTLPEKIENETKEIKDEFKDLDEEPQPAGEKSEAEEEDIPF